jgi:putative component of membrane protein insertase Oxa1/YidC/SpoIIIJ protein YidD
MKRIIVLCAVMLLGSMCSGSFAETSFTPWDFTRQEAEITTGKQNDSDNRYVRLPASVIGTIWKLISAVDGDRCPMFPTWSAYSTEAFRKHGYLVGAVMTADRLIHEADESGIAPRVDVGGRIRSFDPVSQNDFWWYKKAK